MTPRTIGMKGTTLSSEMGSCPNGRDGPGDITGGVSLSDQDEKRLKSEVPADTYTPSLGQKASKKRRQGRNSSKLQAHETDEAICILTVLA